MGALLKKVRKFEYTHCHSIAMGTLFIYNGELISRIEQYPYSMARDGQLITTLTRSRKIESENLRSKILKALIELLFFP